ncbi:hypothetical protein FOBRF1_006541 [Fusarium oxysporum]
MSSSPLRFDGRVAIITGSGRGLGREYALLLSHLGAIVVVNSTTAATAQSTAEDITKAGGRALTYVGSVNDREVAGGLVKAAIDNFGRIDIVINNAGGTTPSDFETTSDSQLWDMVGVHLGGSWNVTQAAWPHMKKQNYGRIIMIASSLMFGSTQQCTYGAAKMSLVGLVKSLALEGKPHNILVNCVAPIGFTPGVAAFIPDEQTHAFMEKYAPAKEVAPTVSWLVHEDSQANGETIGAAGRLVTRIFFAETSGFLGTADQDWTIEAIRDNWDRVAEEKEYQVHTDAAEFGPKLFQRLATARP